MLLFFIHTVVEKVLTLEHKFNDVTVCVEKYEEAEDEVGQRIVYIYFYHSFHMIFSKILWNLNFF